MRSEDPPVDNILVGTDLGPMVQESEAALARLATDAPAHAVYLRGRKLVRVSREHGGADWYRRPGTAPVRG